MGTLATRLDADSLQVLVVVRVIRILRLVRMLRLMVQFKGLWLLVTSLLDALGTIRYVFALLVLFLYMYACASMELITKKYVDSPMADEDFSFLVTRYFSSISVTMLTFVQFVTLDSAAPLYSYMIQQDEVLSLLFLSFLLVVSVAVMSLVTAVMVECSMQRSGEHQKLERALKESRLKKLRPILLQAFNEIDKDKSSTLSLSEVISASPEMAELMGDWADFNDPGELFDILDTDASGELSIDEFIEGMLFMGMSDAPLELLQIRSEQRLMKAAVSYIEMTVTSIAEGLGIVVTAEPASSMIRSATYGTRTF